ncbi:hypothetical protein BZG36_01197 [Bifiguratus adelaidae]|uniref:Hydroxysteroid dehydrogenase-like protein 2 n=1 Tax=Bifiguratus adelaidae TaxID=1938954 RepID=A0A261Y5N9_9FUNG|nr:hypothetical protein BZG36_01197 [Bifiguratus adelaidae]
MLKGRTCLVTGASRGIGLAIGIAAARQGANLEGTIYTAAERIEQAGGQALPVQCDIRNEDDIQAAVKACVERFGGLDILVNNASAIGLSKTDTVETKRFDLMHAINARGTFLMCKHALPHLKSSSSSHILNLAPPPVLRPDWFGAHLAYTMAKYSMSLITLGLSHECRAFGIGVNALWPVTLIGTAAVQNVLGGESAVLKARKPDILADAAVRIFAKDGKTGHFVIDEIFLRQEGVTDFDQYAMVKGNRNFETDLFVDDSVLREVNDLRLAAGWHV